MSGAPTEDSFDSDGETVIGCAPGNIDFSQMRPIEVTEDMSLDGSAENIDVSQMIPQLVTFGPPGDESSKPCIFKVPAILRRHNPKSFTPNSFSFGPLHYKKKKNCKQQRKSKNTTYMTSSFGNQPLKQLKRSSRDPSLRSKEEHESAMLSQPITLIKTNS